MQLEKSNNINFLKYYLGLALQDKNCFSIYDVYWALPYYAINKGLFS